MMLQVNTEKTLPPLKRMLRNTLLQIGAAAFLATLFLVPAVFAQTGALKGKVRNTRGSGIPNATITARHDGKDVKTVRADSKGNFVISGLDAGTYNVVFDADGYATGVLYRVEVKKGTRNLGSRLILSVDQGQQVILRGSVFYREGTSILGAKVELHRLNSDGTTQKLATAFSTVSGEFTFRRPKADATYRIIASYKGVSGSKDLEVDNAAIYRTAITLDLPAGN